MSIDSISTRLPRLGLTDEINFESGIKLFAGCLCIGFICSFIYNAFLHPLCLVPGLFIARFSRIWYIYHIVKGNFHDTNLDIHRRYGKVVRIAPSKASVMSPEALKVVHGQNTEFVKGDWYRVHQVNIENRMRCKHWWSLTRRGEGPNDGCSARPTLPLL